MTKNKKKKVRMLRGERFLVFLIGLFLLLLPICQVFSKALISESSITLEQLKNKINDQEGKIESLNMQIDELASLDKIQEVTVKEGLSYNNTNIKNIIE